MSRLATLCLVLALAACTARDESGELKPLDGDLGPPPSGLAMRDLRRSHGAREERCALFGAAICVCDDLSMAGSLRVRGGSVAVDGRYTAASGSRIDGDLHAWRGVSLAGALHVGGSLVTPGAVSGSGTLYVGGDLDVGDSLSGAGDIVVHGAARVAGGSTVAGTLVEAAKAPYLAPAGAPCACDDPGLLDVDQAVARAKDTATRLTAEDLGSGRTLREGAYFVDGGARFVGIENLRVEGAVSLYVQGDVVSTGDGRIHLAPGATLDLYVSGTVQSAGDLDLGEGGRPDAFRLYLGAGGILQVAGSTHVAGLIYAPKATVSMAGDLVVQGAIFARELSYAGSLEVDDHLPDRASCPDLPPETPPAGAPVAMF